LYNSLLEMIEKFYSKINICIGNYTKYPHCAGGMLKTQYLNLGSNN